MRSWTDSIKQALRNTAKKLSRKSKPTLVNFYHHENIPLKLYLEIAASNDYKRLVISGKATDQERLQAWERIIQKNYEVNGGFDYLNYKDTLQAYGRLVAEYNLIRCYLIKLVFLVDNDYIAFLGERGYKIKTANSIEYAESINACLIRSENLITRITMKANELKEYIKESSGEVTTFEGIMAGLSMSLGFEIKDDITLLRFNEYKKLITKKTFKENG
jgi:hypothetical protein